MAMIVQVHQDKRYYNDEDLIPDGTLLNVIKKRWYNGVLTGVNVIYNNSDIFLAMPDVKVVSLKH